MSKWVVLGAGNGMPAMPDNSFPDRPFPISDAYYPVTISRGRAIKWYWGVKTWHLQTDASASYNDTLHFGEPPDDFTETHAGSVTLTSGDVGGREFVANEDQLIFSPIKVAATIGATGSYTINGDPYDIARSSANVYLFLEPGGPGLQDFNYRAEEGEGAKGILPCILIAGELRPNGFHESLRFSSVYDPEAPGDPPIGNFTGYIDGIPIPIHVWTENFQVYPDYDSSAAPFSGNISQFVLTPLEYWPWRAKDGSPIYDTMTGAKLQDPRN